MPTKAHSTMYAEIGFEIEQIGIQHERAGTSVQVTAHQFPKEGDLYVFSKSEDGHEATLTLEQQGWVECDENDIRWDGRRRDGQPVHETFTEKARHEFNAEGMSTSDLESEVVEFICDALSNNRHSIL